MENNELSHWGIKGMKWGVRRYQTKDGKLTPAGKKRYDDDVAKLKAKKAKLATAQKNKETSDKAKARIEKLKSEVEAKKNKLKGKEADPNDNTSTKKKNDREDVANEKPTREKLLKSSNPEELYRNRHLLSDAEINERLGRIELERKLKAIADKDSAERDAAKRERIDKAIGRLDTVVSIGKGVSNVYELTNTPLGKMIKKKLGFKVDDEKMSKFDFKKAVENMDALTDEQLTRLGKEVDIKTKLSNMSGSKKKPTGDDDSNSSSGKKKPTGDDDSNSSSGKKKPTGDDDSDASSGKKKPTGDDDSDSSSGKKKPTGDDDSNSSSGKKKPAGDDEVETVTGEWLPANKSKKNGNDQPKKSKIIDADFTEIVDDTPSPVSRSALGNLLTSRTGSNLLSAPAKESKIKSLRSSGHTYDEIADQLGVSTTTIAGLLGAGR